jgi:hypothetical protein
VVEVIMFTGNSMSTAFAFRVVVTRKAEGEWKIQLFSSPDILKGCAKL